MLSVVDMPDPSPTRPPAIEPQIGLSWRQKVGVPILLAIPILALFGVFGGHETSAHAKSATLDLTVAYPSRLRYRLMQPLHLTVRNLSAATADTVTVSFDTAYISRFASVKIDPSPKEAYVVDLTQVEPSESRLVSVELWGDAYGNHPGTIVARHGTDSAIVKLSTFVFP
jgi:hypothetical protein